MIRIAIPLCLISASAVADPATVVDTSVSHSGDSWRFDVALEHPDTGWDHYADAWEVLDAQGNSLGIRVLAHPHVNEQPFTRSLGGVAIPDGVTEVFIRTRCNVDSWHAGQLAVALENSRDASSAEMD